MSYYYWFNKKHLLKKTHDKYHNQGGKEITAIYYQENKDAIKKVIDIKICRKKKKI